ncbi:MAG: hypothetical protein E7012_05690 [Alphaproteobacteria bacterium]|nr:hypothetical protein [Alphaproteobacteria bacterium]
MSKIQTECVICYYAKNGKTSYHRYLDTDRLAEVYGIQISPNLMIALKNEDLALRLNQVLKVYDKKLFNRPEKWELPNHEALLTFAHGKYDWAHFVTKSNDYKILQEHGIDIENLYAGDYWAKQDTEYYICRAKSRTHRFIVEHYEVGHIRFFIPMSEVHINDK